MKPKSVRDIFWYEEYLTKEKETIWVITAA